VLLVVVVVSWSIVGDHSCRSLLLQLFAGVFIVEVFKTSLIYNAVVDPLITGHYPYARVEQ
jgi:hypothetical protein